MANKKKPLSLKQKLEKIYNMSDLETNCQGNCVCCKVAMPTMNYCEFVQILNEIWDKESVRIKAEIIKTSIEYFVRYHHEVWGMDKFIKPCMFLKDGRCAYYSSRPLNCRIYGLWPEDEYNKRVESFQKEFGLEKENVPLNTQCPFVERKNTQDDLTMDEINAMYDALNDLDFSMKRFTSKQIKEGVNVRAFHDWICYTFFGEEWLSFMSQLLIRAKTKDNARERLEDQVEQIKKAIDENYINKLPSIKELTNGRDSKEIS
jgi:Fe-S-cluster containining protein